MTSFFDNNIYGIFQLALRPHHSTETTIVRIVIDLLLPSDSGHVSLLVLLEPSAAFDTLDHVILLNWLKKLVLHQCHSTVMVQIISL